MSDRHRIHLYGGPQDGLTYLVGHVPDGQILRRAHIEVQGGSTPPDPSAPYLYHAYEYAGDHRSGGFRYDFLHDVWRKEGDLQR